MGRAEIIRADLFLACFWVADAGAQAGFVLTLYRKLTMSEELQPVFQIQRVYLKEASLEQPNSPAILLVQEQPTVDI